MTNISDREELRKLIARYIRGNASMEEIAFLKKYYEHFDNQVDGIGNLTSEEQSRLKSEIFQEVRHKIESTQQSHNRILWVYRAAAAVLALVITAGIFWYSNPGGEKMEQLVVQVPFNSYVTDTAFARDKHIYLPDGSYVVLEPGSELKYRRGFNETEREVELVGEAYFDVQHDSLRPFLVHANGVTTRVLGTAFSISSRDKSNEFSISVTRGKVEVSDLTHQLGILEKNDQLILDRVTSKLTKNKLKVEETADLVPAEFMMDNMTVAEAIGIVTKRWNCKFEIKNPALKNCRFTTSFVPTDDLEEVVAVIASVIGAEYSIIKNVVSLNGEGCN